MPGMNEMLAGAAHLAARTLVQRQDDATLIPAGPTTTASDLTLSLSPPTASTTSTVQSTSDSDDDASTPTSSPLLFFVALGFGVVFTNLWIIVGVKYCFRYNARNRALRMTEDGDPINMENMPRPHRRRREKKLMTMDEVNEKFPMKKYKNWVASRAREGLPTAGGVSVPPSRANSVREAAGVVPELPKERHSTDGRPATSATSRANAPDSNEKTKDAEEGPATSSTATAAAPGNPSATNTPPDPEERQQQDIPAHKQDDDEDDEDDQIDAALEPDCLGTSGDTCAICIDTLEDDDDVRGLTCGHAFHAGCLDPWLTSRRACCPLCKADYYTPKPRRTHTSTNGELPAPPADGSDPADASGQPAPRINARRNDHPINLPQPPRSAWQSLVARARGVLPGARAQASQPRSSGNMPRRTNTLASQRPRTTTLPRVSSVTPASPQSPAPSVWNRFRDPFPNRRIAIQNRMRNLIHNDNVTPGQLESGVRP